MEVTTNQHLVDVILTSLPDEYEYVRSFSYNQRDFSLLEDVKRTLRNIYVDTVPRYSSRGKFVVGGGVTMRACMRKVTPVGYSSASSKCSFVNLLKEPMPAEQRRQEARAQRRDTTLDGQQRRWRQQRGKRGSRR